MESPVAGVTSELSVESSGRWSGRSAHVAGRAVRRAVLPMPLPFAERNVTAGDPGEQFVGVPDRSAAPGDMLAGRTSRRRRPVGGPRLLSAPGPHTSPAGPSSDG